MLILGYVLYNSNNEHFQDVDENLRDEYATTIYDNSAAVSALTTALREESIDTIPTISSYAKIDGNSGKFNGDNTWGFGDNSYGVPLKTNLYNYKQTNITIISAEASDFTTYLYKDNETATGYVNLRKKKTSSSDIVEVATFPHNTLIKIIFTASTEVVEVEYFNPATWSTTNKEFDTVHNIYTGSCALTDRVTNPEGTYSVTGDFCTNACKCESGECFENKCLAPVVTYTGSCALTDRQEVAEGGYLPAGGYCTNACNCDSGECVEGNCVAPEGISNDSLDSSQYCLNSSGDSVKGNSSDNWNLLTSLNQACTLPCDCKSGLCRDFICQKDSVTRARDNQV